MATKIKEGVEAFWRDNVQPLIDKVEEKWRLVEKTYNDIKSAFETGLKQLWDDAVKLWEEAKAKVVPVIEEAVSAVRDFVSSTVTQVRDAVGSFWNSLPSWLQNVVLGLGAAAAGPIALALKGAQELADYVAKHKDDIIGSLKAAADSALQSIAQAWNWAKDQLKAAGDWLKKTAGEVKSALGEAASAVYSAVDDATGGWLTKLRSAVASVGSEMKGEVCAVAGATMGPCVEQLVPDPGQATVGEETGFATLTVSGDVTIPVEGVPVKVAGGASLNIERTKQKYSVTLSGEGSLAVALDLKDKGGGGGGGGGSSASVTGGIDLPTGGAAKGKIWEKLVGGGKAGGGQSPSGGTAPSAPVPGTAPAAAPATGPTAAPGSGPAPAPGGGGAPVRRPRVLLPERRPAPGGGGGVSGEVEAGYKGSVEAKYEFDAAQDKAGTCSGLGGLSSMLAGFGLAGSLPQPFSAVAAGITQDAFSGQLTSCKFTLTQFGKGTFELASAEGVGSIKAEIASERSLSIESGKEEKTGAEQYTASLSASLSGSLAAELSAGPISELIPLSISGGLTGAVSLTLKYVPVRDEITGFDAEASLTAKLSVAGWNQVRNALPGEVASAVDSYLGPNRGASGELSVSAKYTLDVLKLIQALDAVFADPDSVTYDKTMAAVTKALSEGGKSSFTVKYTETEAMGGASLAVKGGDGEVSGSASISAKRGRKREVTLYPPGGAAPDAAPAAPPRRPRCPRERRFPMGQTAGRPFRDARAGSYPQERAGARGASQAHPRGRGRPA